MNRYCNRSNIISAIVGSLALCGSASAAIIDLDTASGNGADSYISTWPGEPDANFGTTDTIYLKNDWGTGFVNRKGYVRFDLSSVNEPIDDASLSLSFVEDTHTTSAVWSFNVYGLSDGHAGENWSETGITWNNAPANNTSSGGSLLGGQASHLGSFEIDTSTLVAGDAVTFSSSGLTSFLQSDTDDLVTLVFIRPDLTLTNVGFATKEHSEFAPPTLTLTTVPVPGAAILFGAGLLSLIGYNSRHRNEGFTG
jgi:hypothetical protein